MTKNELRKINHRIFAAASYIESELQFTVEIPVPVEEIQTEELTKLAELLENIADQF